MPSPDEIARRNREANSRQEEDKVYQEFMQKLNRYDGTRPIEIQALDCPVTRAVVERLRGESWKVQHIPCGGRTPMDTWKFSGSLGFRSGARIP